MRAAEGSNHGAYSRADAAPPGVRADFFWGGYVSFTGTV